MGPVVKKMAPASMGKLRAKHLNQWPRFLIQYFFGLNPGPPMGQTKAGPCGAGSLVYRVCSNSSRLDPSSLISPSFVSFKYMRVVFIKTWVKFASCCINSGGPAILVIIKALL